MQLLVANNATSTLAFAIAPTDTTCFLQAGTGALFPNPSPGQYFALTFADALGSVREIVYVTSMYGDNVLSMIRGVEGTSPSAFQAGAFAWCRHTAGAARAFAQLPAYDGVDPNGSVPGVASSAFGAASLVWALGGGQMWICTTGGNAAAAVWQPVGSGGRLRVNTPSFDLYVATNGSDSNDGFSTASPLATWQRAWNYLQNNVDLNGNIARVHVAPGFYNQTLLVGGGIVGQNGPQSVVFQGNSANPTDVTLNSPTGFDCIAVVNAAITVGGVTLINNTVSNPDGGGCLTAEYGGIVLIYDMIFGSCFTWQMSARAATIECFGATYAIANGCESHMHSDFGGLVLVNNSSIAIYGLPTFTEAFATALNNGSIQAYGNVYNGTALGAKFLVDVNGTIDTQGAAGNSFPGSLPGIKTNGGQII